MQLLRLGHKWHWGLSLATVKSFTLRKIITILKQPAKERPVWQGTEADSHRNKLRKNNV